MIYLIFFFLSPDFIKKKHKGLQDSILKPKRITFGTQASGHTELTLETKPIQGMPINTYT